MANKKSSSKQKTKPPVVTIMGHVDHGKTTLLDKIRSSSIAASEHGGITQHIGAYQVNHKGQDITFIDTPGHAAFSKMRAHGASVTDIAILVVAADDGVKPQTKESIRHIKEANVPVVVAVNKIDTQGASIEMVKAQLVEEGILVEGYGGDTPVVPVSALKGENIDKLLETVLILAEMEEVGADAGACLQAVVIESEMRKNIGPVATLLVQQGTLKLNDKLVAVGITPQVEGKAKKMLSGLGKELMQITPGMPAEVLGLKSVPPVGAVLTHPGMEGEVGKIVVEKANQKNQEVAEKVTAEVEGVEEQEEVKEKIEIKVMLMADTQGTLDAIMQNISDEVELIQTSVGEVTESDVLHAQTTGSTIIAFNTKVSTSAKKLAEIEGVQIKAYTIIYKLLEDLEKQVLLMLEPTIDEEELGVATTKALFEIKDQVIVGCEVNTGQIGINTRVHQKRKDRLVADAVVVSIRHLKEEIKAAKAGTECGLVLKPSLDIKVGDKIVSYRKKDS